MAEKLESLKYGNFRSMMMLLDDTMNLGIRVSPRGSEIRELLDAQVTLNPVFPFQDFAYRNYNHDYFKQEMRWKLGASKYDDSIKAHAKMWESVQNPDGTFNSNYGQFWFGQQMGLMKAVLELIRDRDSRRASIPMLADTHLSPETRDTVCTEAVTLHIRDDVLHMSVHMRSSDQIFGLGTDVPTFSVLMMLALGLLRSTYHDLELGLIKLTAASSHIYDRHYKMVHAILSEKYDSSRFIQLPEPSGFDEVMAIIAHRGVQGKLDLAHWHLYRFIYG
jgi:thymidylate synthase